MLDAIKNFFSRAFSRTKQVPLKLEVSDEQFSVSSGDKSISLKWAEVSEIVVFKRDLYTVDMLCMAVSLGDKVMELNDQMLGWSEFSEGLPKHLEGAFEFHQWFLYVAFPAFETKPLTIYKRGVKLEPPPQMGADKPAPES